MSLEGSEAPVAGAPSDQDELRAVLARLADHGWDVQLIPGDEPAALRCSRCRTSTAIGSWHIDDERRLEGASDPDDMVLVVAATCPACGAQGAIALGYGPEASEADSDLVAALPQEPRRP